MRFELWSYDEYGQPSIVKSGKELDPILAEGVKFVSSANLDNALAESEKEKAWEAYMPVLVKRGKVVTDMLYAGNRRNGKHQVWVKDKKGNYALADLPKDASVRFVLGEVSKGTGKDRKTETWFLTDHRGNLIDKFDYPDLHAKTQVFVKVLP
jgi:uncharacterized protein YifE (UPF0438 family)